jgi:transcriptional regulator with XRE-family HTH domain
VEYGSEEVDGVMKLKEARLRAGLGRLRCAKLAGIDKPLLYRYELGLRTPGFENATKIAQVLSVELADIEEFRFAVESSLSSRQIG